MLYPVRDLIDSQQVICAELSMTIDDALRLMVENDYSQLPVQDRKGNYCGMLTEHSILKKLHEIGHDKRLLADSIDRWYDDVVPILRPNDELHDIYHKLHEVQAAAVVERNRVVGVLTQFDLAQFFGAYSYAFRLIEGIERTLRRYIEAVLPDAVSRDEAAREAIRSRNNYDPAQEDGKAQKYEDLTLRGYVDLICLRKLWNEFEPYFGDKTVFGKRLKSAAEVRNIAMHFRQSQLNRPQLTTLEEAARLLSRCEIVAPPPTLLIEHADASQETTVEDTSQEGTIQIGSGKYAPLASWLISQSPSIDKLETTFSEIEERLGSQLPPTAWWNKQWWANAHGSHVQSKAWQGAGWKATKVDFEQQQVTFVRERSGGQA